MRGFAWGSVSYGANKVVVFVSTIVLARLLAPDEFGAVAAGMTLVLYFEVALDLGVGATLVYEQERGITKRVQTAFTLNLGMATALTAMGVLAAPLVAKFFHLQHDVLLFRMLFLYLLVRGAGQVQDAILQRDLHFRKRATAVVARGVVRAVVSIVLAVFGAGAWALVGGLLASEATATVLLWAFTRFRPRLSLNRTIVRGLLGFGILYTLLQIVDAIGIDGDYVVVGHIRGVTQLGYYSVGYRLPELILIGLFWMFSEVAFPVYAQANVDDPNKANSVMLRALRVITVFSFPAGVILALCARDVIGVLFGVKWNPAVGPMMLIALTGAVASIGYAAGDLFSARGRPGTLLVLNVPLTAMLIVGFIVAAPYGITAVAATHLVLGIIYQVVRLELTNRVMGTKWRQFFTALGPAMGAVIGTLALAGPLRLALSPGIGALIAIAVAGILGAAAGIAIGSPSTLAELRRIAGALADRSSSRRGQRGAAPAPGVQPAR